MLVKRECDWLRNCVQLNVKLVAMIQNQSRDFGFFGLFALNMFVLCSDRSIFALVYQ